MNKYLVILLIILVLLVGIVGFKLISDATSKNTGGIVVVEAGEENLEGTTESVLINEDSLDSVEEAS